MIYYRVFHDPDSNSLSPCFRSLGGFADIDDAREMIKNDVARRSPEYGESVYSEYYVHIDDLKGPDDTEERVNGLKFIKYTDS